MAKIPVALQIYSVRKDAEKDLKSVLQAVAKMGYEGVEFAGYYGHDARTIRKMLDDFGLKCCGGHLGLNTLMGDELPKTMEFNRILGNKYLIVPGLPQERRASRQAWFETAKLFNEIAARVKKDGFLVGYHNHAIEFKELDGEMPWDTFFGNTKPEVIMQFDTGNALHGGGDPVTFMKKYPGRALTVHLKEFSTTNDKALLGEGDVQWAEFLGLCETTGKTDWYIIEQESYAFSPLECVDKCLQNLRKMGR
jgi:sugar phosphate isomerase/epimerase